MTDRLTQSLTAMLDIVYPIPETRIDVYCMVCKRFLYWKDGQGVSGKSHGLCNDPGCREKIMEGR
jgi:hypothetical protein